MGTIASVTGDRSPGRSGRRRLHKNRKKRAIKEKKSCISTAFLGRLVCWASKDQVWRHSNLDESPGSAMVWHATGRNFLNPSQPRTPWMLSRHNDTSYVQYKNTVDWPVWEVQAQCLPQSKQSELVLPPLPPPLSPPSTTNYCLRHWGREELNGREKQVWLLFPSRHPGSKGGLNKDSVSETLRWMIAQRSLSLSSWGSLALDHNSSCSGIFSPHICKRDQPERHRS